MFNTLFYILLFLFGGSLGSFACVIVDRLYIKSFLTGRSHCDNCNKSLAWYELIPVFSYLFLGGRCRKCKVKIGSQKFYLELLGGVLTLVTYKIYLASYFALPLDPHKALVGALFSLGYIFLFVIFSVIIFYDFRHKLVPTTLALILIITGLAFEAYRAFNYNAFYGGLTTFFYLDLLAGLLIALPFYLIYLFSKKRAVGLGDILIYLGVGYLAGFIFGISIFFISIWLGAAVSILLMVLKPKQYTRHTEIPFTPFIIIATILVMLFQIDILGLVAFL